MVRVAIVTDSSASLPARLARDLGVQVVPIVLALNGHILRDGIDITPGKLYVTEMTPVIGAHTGPGLLGMAFYTEEA
jgi:fatty acid-binding protein DegV